MTVTEIKIRDFRKNNLLGFADVVIDESIVIKNIKIWKAKNNNINISFPSIKGGDEKYRECVYPITKKARQLIADAVATEYTKALIG